MKARQVNVEAKPAGIWTPALESVSGIKRLRITAAPGNWTSGNESCDANGKRISPIPRSACLLVTAPFGALIGKIGGSTAGISDGYVFAVGRSCVLDIGATPIPGTGALYFTINDTIEGLGGNILHSRIFAGDTNADIVVQDVDPSPARLGGGNRRGKSVFLRDVGGEGHALAALLSPSRPSPRPSR